MTLTAQEKDLCRRIEDRGDALLEDLRRHVALPTGHGNAPAIAESRQLLCERAVALGASVELVPGEPRPDWLESAGPVGELPSTAVCRRTQDVPGRRILIAGHLDTVHDPNGSFQELTIAPDGRTAIGPGCVDMKGGLVIGIAAIEALEEAGLRVPWTLTLNADEETGTFHSAKALRAEARRHDLGICVEPALADGGLAVERMGGGQFMIEARGRSAHVGREFEKGVSAVVALAERIVATGRMADPSRGRLVNVGPLEGGKTTNAVPDRARAWGNVRYPSREIAEELDRLLGELETPSDAMPGVTVHRVFNRPAKPLIPPTETLAHLARDAAESLGQALPFGKTGGGSDGNILQDEGLPTLDTLGVRGGALHTTDEWVELPSLVERCQLLAVFMLRAANASE